MTDNPSTTRLAVLASGTGQHLQTLNQAIRAGSLDATIELVVADTVNAPALQYARLQDMKAVGLAARFFSDAASYQNALARRVAASQPDWIILDDFEPVMDAGFAAQFPNRILVIQSEQAGQAQLHLLTPAGQSESISQSPATTHAEVASFYRAIDRVISDQTSWPADTDRYAALAPKASSGPDHDPRIHNA